jgi:hypothetical protein
MRTSDTLATSRRLVRSFSLLASLALILFVVGCGDSTGSSAVSPPPQKDNQEVKDAFKELNAGAGDMPAVDLNADEGLPKQENPDVQLSPKLGKGGAGAAQNP